MEELQRRIEQLEKEVEILKGRSLPSKRRIFLRPHTVVATLAADSSEMVEQNNGPGLLTILSFVSLSTIFILFCVNLQTVAGIAS